MSDINLKCEHKYLPVEKPPINYPYNPNDWQCSLCDRKISWGIYQEKSFLNKASHNERARKILEGYIEAIKTYESKNFAADEDKELIAYAEGLLKKIKQGVQH